MTYCGGGGGASLAVTAMRGRTICTRHQLQIVALKSKEQYKMLTTFCKQFSGSTTEVLSRFSVKMK